MGKPEKHIASSEQIYIRPCNTGDTNTRHQTYRFYNNDKKRNLIFRTRGNSIYIWLKSNRYNKKITFTEKTFEFSGSVFAECNEQVIKRNYWLAGNDVFLSKTCDPPFPGELLKLKRLSKSINILNTALYYWRLKCLKREWLLSKKNI